MEKNICILDTDNHGSIIIHTFDVTPMVSTTLHLQRKRDHYNGIVSSSIATTPLSELHIPPAPWSLSYPSNSLLPPLPLTRLPCYITHSLWSPHYISMPLYLVALFCMTQSTPWAPPLMCQYNITEMCYYLCNPSLSLPPLPGGCVKGSFCSKSVAVIMDAHQMGAAFPSSMTEARTY